MWDKAWDSIRAYLTLSDSVEQLRESNRDLERKVYDLGIKVEGLTVRLDQQKEAERESRENLELKLRLQLHQEFQQALAQLEKKYAKAAEAKPKKASRKRLPPAAE